MKLKISFILLVLLVVNFNVCSNDSLLVHNIKKNTINLHDNNSGILIFASGLACKDCLKELNAVVLSLVPENIFDNIGVLISCKDNIITKKEQIEHFDKFFAKSIYNYYFDANYNDVFFNDGNNTGFWGKYKITVTPCLLVYKNKKIKFIDYNEMFGRDKEKVDLKKLLLKTFNQL